MCATTQMHRRLNIAAPAIIYCRSQRSFKEALDAKIGETEACKTGLEAARGELMKQREAMMQEGHAPTSGECAQPPHVWCGWCLFGEAVQAGLNNVVVGVSN
eukprot:SAG25_NODE_337_length_9543_cov_4.171961_6_plen_102_part_00